MSDILIPDGYVDVTPVMTSNTSPSGYTASASTVHATYQPWYAFDGVDSDSSNTWRVWHSSPVMPQWIMLEFPQEIEVSLFTIGNRPNFGDYDTKGILAFRLEGSDDGSAFTTLGEYTRAGDLGLTTMHEVQNPGKYRFYRIYVTEAGYYYGGQPYAVIEQIRFYADCYSDITPTMTSDTTPSGYTASASSTYGAGYAWKAFDGKMTTSNDDNTWHSTGGMPQWIMLKFPEAVRVDLFTVASRGDTGNADTKGILSFSLQGSNNGTLFDTLGTYTRSGDVGLVTSHLVNNAAEYQYYRIWITEAGYVYGTTQYALVDDIHFYRYLSRIPGPPAGLTAVYVSGAVRLAWTASDNVLAYRIYRGGSLLGETAETSFTDTDTDMGAYTSLTYAVTAVSENGEGSASEVKIFIPGSGNPLFDLITDRTQADVTNRTAKGVYNARDLNRVAEAVGYVRGMLDSYGYAVPEKPKSDWAVNDIPTETPMQAHIDAVRGLDVIRYAEKKITLPVSMEKLGYEGANDIEKFLIAVGEAAERIPYGWMYSGEIFGGEI